MIRFTKSHCTDFAVASMREWLETNGIGGFASSTMIGLNTRRYHGLLTAATKPPVGRAVLLSKLEETLVVGDERFELSTNQYPGAVHPQGHSLLAEFRLDPFPIFVFEAGGLRIEKSVFMVRGHNATIVQYRLRGDGTAQLELRPLIAFRDYHGTTHENGAINGSFEKGKYLVKLAPYQGMPDLYLAHNAAEIEPQGYWYKNFIYEVEQQRGLDSQEDLYNPLLLKFDLSTGEEAAVIASTEPFDIASVAKLRKAEVERRRKVAASAPVDDPFVTALTLAADQFLVKREDGATVMAGYPWFTDWGRDTMIALPGLTLFTGRFEEARSILQNFGKYVDQGMLPNRFPDQGEAAEFNTVDAALWYFEAVRAYLAASADFGLVKELYPVLTSIVESHIYGTRYNIHMLDNGLLNAGEPGVQLTWMDAKVGDWVVTPRIGKPVEIQALWYNALKIIEEFAAQMGDAPNVKRYRGLSTLLHWSFNRVFWNDKAGCLYDVVNGVSDPSIRPNQIFAVSLPHSMLAQDRAKAVVQVVERELLTPCGLRTLNPGDPSYRARYGGDQYSRDSAYHQGTVWPWLLGPFITAYVKVNSDTEAARKRAGELLKGLEIHLGEAGLGQISEVFDAEYPHVPGGCFAQAWSVGELLRAACEDIFQVKPRSAFLSNQRQAAKASSSSTKRGIAIAP